MTPEHLVDSAKLYDYYVNGFTDNNSTHTARVHLSTIKSDSTSSAPTTSSAPSLMDLLHTDNIEPIAPSDADIAAMEDIWFNNPDPYYLTEMDSRHVDPALQNFGTRSSTIFDISEYIKLDDPKLTALISNVDSAGPGASSVANAPTIQKPVGKPGEWSVDSFLDW